MNIKNSIGYMLLVVGLLIIGLTLYYSYAIFTGKSSAPLVFKAPVSQVDNTEGNGLSLQQQLNKTVSKELLNLLPLNTISNFLNLTAWSILAMILILGGSQIASLGIKLIT